ncbi:MAG: DEAD/DEAH box helicase [Planctomycetota bacterium]|jgi:superfamily II DNA/RNA helicase
MDPVNPNVPSRDDLAERYLDQLPYEPYPFQEEALLAWFSADQGLLVCAPTGMGKTLIAEAAVFEALHTGTTVYYTTPLIALTEQKFREMQASAVRWGFHPDDVGLVTGNRRENPDAKALVVVAEILFNRLLHPEAFDFSQTSAVVMDEFHSFNDPERGIVWELTLGLLPQRVRTLLLSATVGNSPEFIRWLRSGNDRRLELVESDERKVPLTFQWVPDRLLPEQIEAMADGDEAARLTPALVFCFNREECWSVAEQLKGRKVLADGQQDRLVETLKAYDWSQGAGPKLRQLLLRGVGVHHAGVLPKYRRIVEDLFQKKLLSICTCTETLSAGINLPARSVVVPRILKGPPGKKKILEPSTAHQIFGRAGRPQYDTHGYVFVLAHEDDVKIERWRRKYDQIPDDVKDPSLRKAKKQLKKKMPKRRTTEQYWSEAQFEKLRVAPPGNLRSRGPLPWRLLAYMLEASPEVEIVRRLVGKRLLDSNRLEGAQRALDGMLLTLWRAGYVTLEPEPPKKPEEPDGAQSTSPAEGKPKPGLFSGALPFGLEEGDLDEEALEAADEADSAGEAAMGSEPHSDRESSDESEPYRPVLARPTPELAKLLLLRGVNPLYGVFLVNQLGVADRQERIQAVESVLELPRSVGYHLRVPGQEELPPGPLATIRLDPQLLRLGLASPEELVAAPREEDRRYSSFDERPPRVLTLADKLRLLFDYDFPSVHDVRTFPVWVAGELLEFGGEFNKYATSKRLQKQEGVVFRHLLRLILLLREFMQFVPPDSTEEQWRGDLDDVADRLTESCRRVDPTSTDKVLEQAQAAMDLADGVT